MLLGALLGSALLGPLARARSWTTAVSVTADDPSGGWVLWVALALLLGESLTALALGALGHARAAARDSAARDSAARAAEPTDGGAVAAAADDDDDPTPPSERVAPRVGLVGYCAAASLCAAALPARLGLAPGALALALALGAPVASLAVRALGETDLNPASAVGKLAQLAFAGLAAVGAAGGGAGGVVPNLVAGAIAEAGAQQSGDMMQDLKTGLLLGVSPRAQLVAQLVGSFCSVFVTVGAYNLYTSACVPPAPPLHPSLPPSSPTAPSPRSVPPPASRRDTPAPDAATTPSLWSVVDRSLSRYAVPSAMFPAPTAMIWLDMARLVNGGALPAAVAPFCGTAAALGAAAAAAKHAAPRAAARWPSAVAVAIGMYLPPRFTIPRVVGAVGAEVWRARAPGSHRACMVVVASGFVLGEGVTSLFTAVAHSLGVQPLVPEEDLEY